MNLQERKNQSLPTLRGLESMAKIAAPSSRRGSFPLDSPFHRTRLPLHSRETAPADCLVSLTHRAAAALHWSILAPTINFGIRSASRRSCFCLRGSAARICAGCPDLTFDPQLFHQVQKLAHRSSGFNPHPHRAWKLRIKLPHAVAFVQQRYIHYLPRYGVQHRQPLLASVQITSYNSHLGLLRSERCNGEHQTVHSGRR